MQKKRSIRFGKWLLTLLVCLGVCLISGSVLTLTKDAQDLLTVRLLRTPFLALMVVVAFSFIPLLMYWMNCSGTSFVQRVYLAQNQLRYSGCKCQALFYFVR